MNIEIKNQIKNVSSNPVSSKNKKSAECSADFFRNSIRESDKNVIDLSSELFTKKTGEIPTRIPELDNIIGGGLPKGKLTEIFGWEASGKTVIWEGAVTSVIAEDGFALVIEPEKAHDKNRIRQKLLKLPNIIDKMPNKKELSISEWNFLKSEQEMSSTPIANSDKLFDPVDLILWSGADRIEDVLKEQKDVMNDLKKMKGVDFPSIIVLDSLAACGSITEESMEVGEKHYSAHAMALSSELRNHLIKLAAETNVCLVWLNQLREKIQSGNKFKTGPAPTSDDYSTFGGKSVRFYASLRLNVEHGGKYKLDDENHTIVGQFSKVSIVKSKLWGVQPYKRCKYLIGYDGGTNSCWGIYECLKSNKIIKSAGIKGSKVEGIDDDFFVKNEWFEFYKRNENKLKQIVSDNQREEEDE